MKGQRLSVHNHVARYCAPSKLNAAKDRPTSAAFMLRSGGGDTGRETFLSVYWLERLAGTDLESWLQTLRAYPKTSPHAEPEFSKNGLFAIFETGATEHQARDAYSISLEIAHAPRHGDQTDPHSGIWWAEEDSADLVAAVLAEMAGECIRRVKPST